MQDHSYIQNAQATAEVTATISIPVGTVVSYAGSVAPDGWLLCNGTTITQAGYPALYGLIGGHTPDLRSRFVVCAGQGAGLSNRSLNATGGEEDHTLSIQEMPSHNHQYGVGGGSRLSSNGGIGNSEGYGTNSPLWMQNVQSTGGSSGHNNMPPFYALTYIIKY